MGGNNCRFTSITPPSPKFPAFGGTGWKPKGAKWGTGGHPLLTLLGYGMMNGLEHGLDIIFYLVIPKADHSIPLGFKIGRAFGIRVFLIQMLAAIHFDNEFLSRRAEINDEGTDGMLPAKTDPGKLVGPQP